MDFTAVLTLKQLRCRPGNAPAAYLGSRPTSDSLQVQPGPSWRALLLTPDAPPSWLQGLLSHLQGRPDAALAQQARQLVVSSTAVPVTALFPADFVAHHAMAPSHEVSKYPQRLHAGVAALCQNQKQPWVLQTALTSTSRLQQMLTQSLREL